MAGQMRNGGRGKDLGVSRGWLDRTEEPSGEVPGQMGLRE